MLVQNPIETADIQRISRKILERISLMWVLQIHRIAWVGADFNQRIGISPRTDAVALHTATPVSHLDMIVFVGLQADGPRRVARGNVQRTDFPLVVERRIVNPVEAVDVGNHLRIAAILLLVVAARQFHLAEFHLKTRQHFHSEFVLANQCIGFLLANFHSIGRGRKRSHGDAVGGLSARRPIKGILVIIWHSERYWRLAANGHFGAASDFARVLRLRRHRKNQGRKQQQSFEYDGFVSHPC